MIAVFRVRTLGHEDVVFCEADQVLRENIAALYDQTRYLSDEIRKKCERKDKALSSNELLGQLGDVRCEICRIDEELCKRKRDHLNTNGVVLVDRAVLYFDSCIGDIAGIEKKNRDYVEQIQKEEEKQRQVEIVRITQIVGYSLGIPAVMAQAGEGLFGAGSLIGVSLNWLALATGVGLAFRREGKTLLTRLAVRKRQDGRQWGDIGRAWVKRVQTVIRKRRSRPTVLKLQK